MTGSAGRLLTEQATVGGSTRVTERRHYGEGAAAAAKNTRGRLDLQHDDAGTVETEGYDIDGAPIATIRIVRQAYETAVDWVDPGVIAMDGASYRTEWQRDALGRETRMVAADSVVHLKTYDRLGGLLTYTAEEVGGAWTENVVTGGTRVGGHLLDAPHRLRNRDVVRIGDTVLVFRLAPLSGTTALITDPAHPLVGISPDLGLLRSDLAAIAPRSTSCSSWARPAPARRPSPDRCTPHRAAGDTSWRSTAPRCPGPCSRARSSATPRVCVQRTTSA